MKMRAAVLERFGEPLEVQELDLAEPRGGEVLVRLVARGVCHTDLFAASGADPSGYSPAVLGHEGAGVVEAVGEGVRDVAVGDHVVTLFSPQCRECEHCLDPRTNLCMAIREQQGLGYLPDGTARLSRAGKEIRHFMGCSTFAEYAVMWEIALAKVSPEAPLDRACLFACGLSTGLGAAINTARVEAGSTCVVFGAGMVGLGAAWLPPKAPSRSSASTSPTSGRARTRAGHRHALADRCRREVLELVDRRAPTTRSGQPASSPDAPGGRGRRGWAGACNDARRGGGGETLEVVPQLPDHRTPRGGSSFGGAGRDQVPQLVDRWLAVRSTSSRRLAQADAGRREPRGLS
jgi:S-(hydroxymethyl)glutathione dehydrogenase/alcohol dehydrogenase